MKKIIFLILSILGIIFFASDISYAQLKIPGADAIKEVSISSNKISDGGAVTIDTARSFGGSLLSVARIVISGFALIYIVLIGGRMILYSDEESEIAKQKKQIFYTLVAFVFLNVPDMVYRIFMNDNRGELRQAENWTDVNTNNSNFWNTDGGNFGLMAFVEGMVNFLKVFAFIAAIISFAWGAYQLLLSRGKDDYKENAQNRMIYGVMALIFLGIIEAWTYAVRQTNIQESIGSIAGELFGVAFFFAAPVAVFFLILGAYYYITSGGDEEKAKKGKNIFIYTIIATIILIAGASFLSEIINLFNDI